MNNERKKNYQNKCNGMEANDILCFPSKVGFRRLNFSKYILLNRAFLVKHLTQPLITRTCRYYTFQVIFQTNATKKPETFTCAMINMKKT